MTVAVPGLQFASDLFLVDSFCQHNPVLRREKCLQVARFFTSLAESVPPREIEPGDLGISAPGVMGEADL